MEQDIDELLEEVEKKFITQSNDDACKQYKFKKSSPTSSYSDDTLPLDDILPDVVPENDTRSLIVDLSGKRNGKTPHKCFPLYLSGSNVSCGLSAIGSSRSCNNLHCTTCDFAVWSFDNFQWLKSTDYLFLRTNMPDFEHIRTSLEPANGWKAYACQCHHFSTSVLQEVQCIPTLTWICRGH